ncbi:hypothetical protein SEUCBS139899_006330 [Sporothrix eucalyptigena]|uniref:Major facilitator superfamily (MFS) profile domain-containing protein n=1 Tax=Sporothrix eucalyptigena TaxID=1812306 RepID=A0ABP0BY08_9PEZI
MDTSIEHRESPGTVTLVDLDGNISAKHSSSQKEIILSPTPSADPNDPLNWSPWRKWRTTLCTLLFTWCICCSSSACFSVFVPIYEQSGISLDHLNQGTGYMYLLFGWGLLFWQPLALTFGRRGVFLLCLLGTCMMNVWAGYAVTNGQWIASRILIGFFGAPSEALAEVVMADLWFAHERGTYMGLYVMALYGGQLAAVPAGYITNAMGWPWVLWFCAILNAFGFVACFFCLEETMYNREELPTTNVSAVGAVAASSAEAVNSTEKDLRTKKPDSSADSDSSMRGRDLSASAGTSYPVRSYWQKLAFFRALDGRRNTFWEQAYKPLLLVRFPGIVFGGFIYGCYLNWFSIVNATVSIFFSASPYDWSAANVGLSYIAELLGTYLSGFVAGRLADRLTIYLAKRNGGVMEPEFRLWMFALLALLAPFGLFLYGIGYAHGLSYWSMLFGMVMIGFVGPACGSLTVTYIVDCYREISGEALITVILIRNTMNFGFNYGVTPWVDNMGAQNTFLVAGVVAFVSTLVFLIMIFWGKKMRMACAATYWEMVEDSL